MSAWSSRTGSPWEAYGTCLVGEGGGRRLKGKEGGKRWKIVRKCEVGEREKKEERISEPGKQSAEEDLQ